MIFTKLVENFGSACLSISSRKCIGFFLGSCPSTPQISWKSVAQFLIKPADRQTSCNESTTEVIRPYLCYWNVLLNVTIVNPETLTQWALCHFLRKNTTIFADIFVNSGQTAAIITTWFPPRCRGTCDSCVISSASCLHSSVGGAVSHVSLRYFMSLWRVTSVPICLAFH